MYLSSVALLAFSLFAKISDSNSLKIGRTKSSKSSKGNKGSTSGAVFTMTNGKDSNEIIMYSRNSRGMLTLSDMEGDTTTGGNGGPALGGVSDDPFGSQDPIIVAGKCLIAVNAGSNDITSFKIMSKKSIVKKSLVGSEGTFPISLTESKGVVYVLNSGDGGSIHGFRLNKSCELTSIAASTHTLGQTPADGDPIVVGGLPPLLSAPTQISFTPNGGSLIVSIKGIRGHTNFGGSIMQFSVDSHTGLAEANPTENLIGTDSVLPFSFTFDNKGSILLVDALGKGPFPNGNGSVLSYKLRGQNMEISRMDRITLGDEVATCWIKYNDGCAFTTNSITSSVSGVSVNRGKLSNNIVAAKGTEEGGLNNPLDLNFSRDGFLYVLSTNSGQQILLDEHQPAIHVYERNNHDDCTLTEIQVINDGIPVEVDNAGPNTDRSSVGTVGLAVY